jgi:hypothetical protein
MVRRTWRQVKGVGMVEVTPQASLPEELRFDGDFISPVDGSIIRNKRELHEHNKRNNVVQTTDGHDQDWAGREKERAGFYGSKAQKEERIEAVKESLYKLGAG